MFRIHTHLLLSWNMELGVWNKIVPLSIRRSFDDIGRKISFFIEFPNTYPFGVLSYGFLVLKIKKAQRKERSLTTVCQ